MNEDSVKEDFDRATKLFLEEIEKAKEKTTLCLQTLSQSVPDKRARLKIFDFHRSRLTYLEWVEEKLKRNRMVTVEEWLKDLGF